MATFSGKRTLPQAVGLSKAQRGPEGDDENWTCMSCGNLNYGSRSVCNKRTCGKPKPTVDWVCVGCGNNNFASRLFCNMRRCQLARPGLTAADMAAMAQVQAAPVAMTPMYTNGGASAKLSSAPAGSWQCRCSNVNYPNRTTCNSKSCGLPREQADLPFVGEVEAAGLTLGLNYGGYPTQSYPTHATQPYPVQNGKGSSSRAMAPMQTGRPVMGQVATKDSFAPSGSWKCSACQNVNYPQRTTCNGKSCGRPREEVELTAAAAAPPGSWTCPNCANINFPNRAFCNKKACGQPKPE